MITSSFKIIAVSSYVIVLYIYTLKLFTSVNGAGITVKYNWNYENKLTNLMRFVSELAQNA